jgi:hypothetical protein
MNRHSIHKYQGRLKIVLLAILLMPERFAFSSQEVRSADKINRKLMRKDKNPHRFTGHASAQDAILTVLSLGTNSSLEYGALKAHLFATISIDNRLRYCYQNRLVCVIGTPAVASGGQKDDRIMEDLTYLESIQPIITYSARFLKLIWINKLLTTSSAQHRGNNLKPPSGGPKYASKTRRSRHGRKSDYLYRNIAYLDVDALFTTASGAGDCIFNDAFTAADIEESIGKLQSVVFTYLFCPFLPISIRY